MDPRVISSRLYAPLASPGCAVLLAVTPALLAIAWYQGFVTQDGPAHLYNAHIIARSVDAGSPFGKAFSVRWEPLPNWAGHLADLAIGACCSRASRIASAPP